MSKQSIIYLINLLSINYTFGQTNIQDNVPSEVVENQLVGSVETNF
jgi:hypothetical protein